MKTRSQKLTWVKVAELASYLSVLLACWMLDANESINNPQTPTDGDTKKHSSNLSKYIQIYLDEARYPRVLPTRPGR